MKFEGLEVDRECLDSEELDNNVAKVKNKADSDEEQKDWKEMNRAKILTQNMFLRPVVKTNESDYKYERLEYLGTLIHEFDILCFQEVFSGLNCFKPTLLTMAK